MNKEITTEELRAEARRRIEKEAVEILEAYQVPTPGISDILESLAWAADLGSMSRAELEKFLGYKKHN